MSVDTDPELLTVQLPAYDGPAIHVCRWPVPAPRDVLRQEMNVPAPKVPPWERYAFAIEKLLLPEGFAGRRLPVLPADVDHGLCPLWTVDSGSPLLLPVAAVRERVLQREWPMVVMATPAAVGVVAHPETLAEVAWAVLCRAPRAGVAGLLAELSAVADHHRLNPAWLERFVRSMRPPPAVAGRLLGAARSGQPLLDPRCLRWILREIVVVTDAERNARGAWATESTDARLVAHAWFPCLRRDAAPSEHEVLLAAWLLHETFHKTDMSEPSEQEMLSTVTMLGYRVGPPGSWLSTLERWLAIWSVADADPAVAGQRNPPSTLRSMYGTELGLPVDAWLAGVWALCLRWWAGFEGVTKPVNGEPEDLFVLPFESHRIELNEAFVDAFQRQCTADLDSFATAVREEAGGTYDGLGTLPRSDSWACRSKPVLRLPNGQLRPLGIDLVAEGAVALHRSLLVSQLGDPRAVGGNIGPLFQAYVARQLDRIRQRHVVLHEHELTAQLGQTQRCDAIVGYFRSYLAVETSIQALAPGLADGSAAALDAMAERYQGKADQACATVNQMGAITRGLGLPQPTDATHLLVTEIAVPPNPLFLRKLRACRPDRTPRFVCGIADLEYLVALGEAGWDVPGLVANWQLRPDDVSLETHLRERARTWGARNQDPDPKITNWLDRLPT